MKPINISKRQWLLRCLAAGGALTMISSVHAANAEKSISLDPFESLSTDLPAEIRIVIGQPHGLRVRAEQAVLSKIGATVANGVLTVTATGSFQTDRSIQVELRTPTLRVMTLDGAASVSLDSLTADKLEIHAAGSSEISATALNLQQLSSDLQGSSSLAITGKAADQQVKISDAASYQAESLLSDSATVRVEGSGDAVMNVSKHLNVTIEGAGSVEYVGSPSITQRIADAGSLDKR